MGNSPRRPPAKTGIAKRLDELEIRDEQGRIRVADPAVIEVAVTMYNIYREFTGKNFTSKNLILLYKAAQKCIALKETPERYMATQLQGMTKFSIFYPQAIGSEAIREEALSKTVTLDTVQYYRAMLESYKELERVYGSRILGDPSRDFSPLFKYAILTGLNRREEAMKYHTEANRELLVNKVAKDVFGELLKDLHAYNQ